MSSEQAKPTKGKLSVRKSDFGDLTVWDENDYPVASLLGRSGEDKPNADLIAEAFNILHETGLTPRQLADELQTVGAAYSKVLFDRMALTKQRDELLAALVKALPAIEEIRLVDLGALRDAENLGIASKIHRARRELAERVEIINTINTAIASAKGGAA